MAGYNYFRLRVEATGSRWLSADATTTTTEIPITEKLIIPESTINTTPDVEVITPFSGRSSMRSISKDGKRFYSVSGRYAWKSDNWCSVSSNWEIVHNFGEGGLTTHMTELDDGTILITGRADGETHHRIIRKGPDDSEFATVLTLETENASAGDMTWSQYGNVVTCGEYGSPPSVVGASNVYISLDYGATWARHDLIEITGHTIVDRYHIHATCYDPYEQIIWVCVGDSPDSTLFWTKNFGKTWNQVWPYGEGIMLTSVHPLPNCVLFGSDAAFDGVMRYNRVPGGIDTREVVVEPGHIHEFFGLNAHFVGPSVTDYSEPATWWGFRQGAGAQNELRPATIWGTSNGHDVYPVWVSDAVVEALSDSVGIGAVVGPVTPDGYIGARYSTDAGGSRTTKILKVKVR